MSLLIVPGYFIYALTELHVAEVPGPESNPRIVRYWEEAKTSLKVTEDTTAWCAAFVGAMLLRDGVEPTRMANAKSYAIWGDEWRGLGIGAVVVLNRDLPAPKWSGHVGFLAGLTATHVNILGGNQGDKVSIASFPRSRVMTIRQPKGIKLPSSGFILPVTAIDPGVA